MRKSWRNSIPILIIGLCFFSIWVGHLRIFGWTKAALWHLKHRDEVALFEVAVKVPRGWWVQPTPLPGTVLFLRVPPSKRSGLIQLYLQAHRIPLDANAVPIPPDIVQAGKYKLSKTLAVKPMSIGGEKAYYFVQPIVSGSDQPGSAFHTWLIPSCEFKFVAVDVPAGYADYCHEILEQVSFQKHDGKCTGIANLPPQSTNELISLEEQLSR